MAIKESSLKEHLLKSDGKSGRISNPSMKATIDENQEDNAMDVEQNNQEEE
jgi:hypothetical protein